TLGPAVGPQPLLSTNPGSRPERPRPDGEYHERPVRRPSADDPVHHHPPVPPHPPRWGSGAPGPRPRAPARPRRVAPRLPGPHEPVPERPAGGDQGSARTDPQEPPARLAASRSDPGRDRRAGRGENPGAAGQAAARDWPARGHPPSAGQSGRPGHPAPGPL